MQRLGEIMAYELSKHLDYQATTAETVLGQAQANVIKQQPVLVPILRAALPFYNGFLNYFEDAATGFVGAYRNEEDDTANVSVNMAYKAIGDVSGKTVIMLDPMLATGTSLVQSVDWLLKNGQPKHLHIVNVIAAPEGIHHVQEHLSGITHSLWVCAIDEKLNEKAYIVPGLGDAGDLSFGAKL